MEPAADAGGGLGETLAAFEEVGAPGAPLTTREVAQAAGCTRRTAYDRLERLAERGAVDTKKVGARGRVWWRPPEDPDATPADASGSPTGEPCERSAVECVSVETPDRTADECVPAAVLDVADAAVFVLDDEFEVAWVNRTVERFFGLDRDDVVGRDKRAVAREAVADVVADGDRFEEAVSSTYGGSPGPWTFGFRVTAGPDREERWLEHHSKPIESGRYAGGRVEVYYDVTERREYERALEAERDRLERVLETSPNAIAVFAADGTTVTANAEAADLLGVPADGVDEYTLGDREVRDPSGGEVPYDERPIARVFETGEPVSGVEIQLPDGEETRWASVDATPLTDDAGAVTHVVAAATDVTRLKEQSRRLASRRDELADELEEVFERVDDAFYALDDEWRLTYVNDRAEAVLGQSEEQLLGRTIWEAFPPADDGVVRERYERAMATQEPVQFETFYEPLDVWVEVNAYPSESGLSVYFRDVTDRKERELELERYETVVETVQDGIFALDPAGRFAMVNDALCEMTGYDREELVGGHAKLVHGESVDEEEAGALLAEVVDSGETASLEFDLRPKEGDPVPVETGFAPYVYDGATALAGVVRDVSERKQFEETLTALHDTGRELFDAETATEVGEVVVDAATGVLDLAGVAVYRYDADADELVPDAESLAEGLVCGTLPAVPTDRSSLTGHVFVEGEPRQYEDVQASPHLGECARGMGVRGGLFVPMDDYGVLVVGSAAVDGVDDETRRLVEVLAANAVAAYDRVHREQQLRLQRDRLRALDDLNAVVRGINEALVEQSSREEVGEVVCERLAASDSYEFAWFGDVDPKRGVVESEVEVGVEDYLPEIALSTGPDDDVPVGPLDRAVRTHEVQVVEDALEDPAFGPWREYAREFGFRSAAAVPVVHEDTLYGLVGVYAEEPGAFGGEQRAVVAQLGTVVGHAIASIERKRALLSDEVVEVEFRIRDVFEAVGEEAPSGGTIRFEQAVPAGDDTYLVYGSADADGAEGVGALADGQPHWEDLSVLARDRGRVTFEVTVSEPPVVSLVAARGGYLAGATVEDGDYHMTLHLPPERDVRQVIEAVEDAYPAAEMLTRRQVTRTGESAEPLGRAVADRLTDRQRAALEAAFYSGYFEWPRDSTGEDVADSLGVAAPTFHQHVRAAQRKLLEAAYHGRG